MIQNSFPAWRLTAQQARNLHLSAQGVLRKPPARPRRADVLATIKRMQLLQIDTIHVVARSPYLVLFSRLGNYPVEWLDQALERGEIFEGWAHEACFVPSSRYAAHEGYRASGARDHHWASRNAARQQATDRAGMDSVLARIREKGPMRSSEFETTHRVKTGWWDWKDEKRWLEALFTRGELMVARRDRFQRVYDLGERVVARMDIDPHNKKLDHEEIARALILDSVRALGIAQARWIADYYRTRGKRTDADLAELIACGELIKVEVDGWGNPGYVHRDDAETLDQAMAGKLWATHTTLLSPFDPVVWDRARASVMFGFDYTIECYVPEPKRRYGYFVLPILHCGRLIGRLDAKAHRTEGMFEVKSIHLEADIETNGRLIEAVAKAIQTCARWHQTPKVVIRRSAPRSFAATLRKTL